MSLRRKFNARFGYHDVHSLLRVCSEQVIRHNTMGSARNIRKNYDILDLEQIIGDTMMLTTKQNCHR
jgi:hypothetical protein